MTNMIRLFLISFFAGVILAPLTFWVPFVVDTFLIDAFSLEWYDWFGVAFIISFYGNLFTYAEPLHR